MTALERAAREASGRTIAALAARFRDLDIAEEAYADACARAAAHWTTAEPRNPAAWLYRTAERRALDLLRRRRVRARHTVEEPAPEPNPEELLADDTRLIPDERLRLIFVCCHPAIATESRAALTLKLVCGLTAAEIASAFIISEDALMQRLLRAKRKIAAAGIPYEVPSKQAWPERIEAVLTTLEVAYAKAHEDAAGAGAYAGFANEILHLTAVLTDLMPSESQVAALAALVRYAEARRPARVDETGAMVPLAEQDPRLWDRALVAAADRLLGRAADGAPHARVLEAAIHAAWCARTSRNDPPPWRIVLGLYDTLLLFRDDPIIRLNRAVALSEVAGPEIGLNALAEIDAGPMSGYRPYWALRADLLRRLDQAEAARLCYATALALSPTPAERQWLDRQMAACRETTLNASP